MLELCDLYKSYRQGSQDIEALRGVSLQIAGSGFFAVMGASGSGKSTLLHLCAGLDRPERGRVVVDGLEISGLSEGKLTQFRRRKVGIVFQQFNLIGTLTARQNIALPGMIDGQNRRWINERVDELLERLALTSRANHRPEALSGGEQQRVAIARALLFGPPLLLADEPTGNLDAASSDLLWQLLAQLAGEKQMTVVMVTHEPAAAAHCQHVFVLGDGKLKGEFAVKGQNASSVASSYQQLSR